MASNTTVDEFCQNTIDISSDTIHCTQCGSLNKYNLNIGWMDRLLKEKNKPNQFDNIMKELINTYTIDECDHAINLLSEVKSNIILLETGKKNIFIDVKNQDIDMVKKYLDLNIDINIMDSNDNSLMHYASQSGNIELVELLLDRGADLRIKNNNFNTPLHIAAEYGHVKVINVFLNKGVYINIRNNSDNTPLHLASSHDRADVVSALLDKNAKTEYKNNNNQTPIMCANTEDVFLEFVYRNLISDDEKQDLLFKAIENDWVSLFNKLMHLNAINAQTKDYMDSPLIIALEFGRVEFAKKLLENGADVNYKNKNNITALHIAAYCGHFEIVELLIQLNANIDDKGGLLDRTALQFASLNGHSKIVECLLSHRANILYMDKIKRTALHCAAISDSSDTLRVLIKAGSKNTTRDYFGLTSVAITTRNLLYKQKK